MRRGRPGKHQAGPKLRRGAELTSRFKTGFVLAEQPPIKDGQVEQGWWDIYGGKPDVIGADLAEVAKGILAAGR